LIFEDDDGIDYGELNAKDEDDAVPLCFRTQSMFLPVFLKRKLNENLQLKICKQRTMPTFNQDQDNEDEDGDDEDQDNEDEDDDESIIEPYTIDDIFNMRSEIISGEITPEMLREMIGDNEELLHHPLSSLLS
jgi:hypothetical protein